MPVVQSHLWMTTQIRAHNRTFLYQRNPNRKPDFPLDCEAEPHLLDLSSAVSRLILENDAAIVAAAAGHTASRDSLMDLIARRAEQISSRAGFFKREIQNCVIDFLFGYGPLQSLIDDPSISDIDGTGPDSFSVTRQGVRQFVPTSFSDEKTYDTFCRLLIIRNGGIINENDSHCRVTDERYRLRINVTVPPRSIPYPAISIRKHPVHSLKLDDLVRLKMMDQNLSWQISRWAQSGRSVMICGKGAAGKTTLLRAWIEAMPELDRVLVAESDSELYPEKKCCLLQRVKRKEEGGRPVCLFDLVRDGLTLSLDAYCVGEIVDEEAMAMIHAAFSGHRCLATIHAEQASDVPDRLMTLARPSASGESDRTLRRMIGAGLDLIIRLDRFKIREVIAVRGYLEGDDRYDLETVWFETDHQTTDASAGECTQSLVSGS